MHALLHIADAIKAMGPVWAAWAFPTERGCGRIQRSVKGKRFLYSSIDKYVLQESQLSLVKLKFPFMKEELALQKRSQEKAQAVGNCEHPVPPIVLSLITPAMKMPNTTDSSSLPDPSRTPSKARSTTSSCAHSPCVSGPQRRQFSAFSDGWSFQTTPTGPPFV